MKTITLIYHKLFTFIYLLLITIIFFGCKNKTTKQKITIIDKIYPIIDKIETGEGNGYEIIKIRLYIIDNCEYIGGIYNGYGDFLTHKGNCKYCIKLSNK